MKNIILSLFGLFLTLNVLLGQNDGVWFEPNRGQWDGRILYKVSLSKGDFFVEKDKFTYALSDIDKIHTAAHEGKAVGDIKHHTIHTHFLNSTWQGEVEESKPSKFYKNYFIGNDQSKWQTNIHAFKVLRLSDFYPGIDLILETSSEHIKYSFEVHPGADPSQIQLFYEGMTALNVQPNVIDIQTRFGTIKEKDLKVWTQASDGGGTTVDAQFEAVEDTVVYAFSNGYDSTKTLIIDPSLTFSTFTGSTSDNWGFTAAPDDDGNLYAGGIVFGTGYPISTGAYDASFNGGDNHSKIDIGISKFSSDGTSLLYSTYLGGSGNETPNSIITNNQDELFILGISTSPNYPIGANAFQSVNQGGFSTTQIGIDFNGSDIVISKLNASGTSLLGSTYFGGSKNDGLNISTLNYNYGDVFRGEIILDLNGDVLINSSTHSTDIPIVNGANTTIGGAQDAIVAKFQPDLSNLIWSSYFGGDQDDAGYSIQVSSTNSIFISGGTKSTGLPFSGGHQSSFGGGSADGYVAELDGNTSAVLNGTYIGTNQYDQSFFVQLDQSDRVYVFGQTTGPMTISSGVYSNPNSGQFIQQYSADLSTQNWSTIVGGGNGVVEISPTAFLVSNCNEIYYTGWGGMVNRSVQATASTSNGFPTTFDAYQSNTNGSNFYIGVLSENATALNYGTFMGGVASSSNHVDGGTSRFDKQGRIYHAVCGACGGDDNGFTTTPGVFSTTNNSYNCNLAAWKFDLGAIYAATSLPSSYICLPDSAHFSNDSQNGSAYFWDFGDGTTSTAFEPSHFYDTPGIYEVMFVVQDVEGCFDPDTTYLEVEIGEFNGAVVQPGVTICPQEPFQLEASGGMAYEWSPSIYLDDASSPTPIATVDTTTTFSVIITDSCGRDSLSITLTVIEESVTTSDDLEICIEDTVRIWADGGQNYSWTADHPNAIIGADDLDTIRVAPTQDTEFTVEVETINGCILTKTVNIEVFLEEPSPVLNDSVPFCEGDEAVVFASGAPTIIWSPNINISDTIGSRVSILSDQDRWYYVDFTNPCGTVRDSVFLDEIVVDAQAGNDTIVCPREKVDLWASGGVVYSWKPDFNVADPNSAATTAKPNIPTTYTVNVTDNYGCVDTAQVEIEHFPQPYLQVSADYFGFVGDEVPLSAESNQPGGNYAWSPTEFLSCVNCTQPIATPPQSMVYTVSYVDENGCKATDEVAIKYEALIYVPNTFTPDGKGTNEVFTVKGGNITYFELVIYNRWGEEIYRSTNMEEGWDGTYNGKPCKDGTYVWKITYEDIEYNREKMVGHVNLLR
ncbi:hypothetical protein CW751_13060 [Brumimicrobium salinarum]|uniref:PKD domain-containing protein n=1 Tax=Brumimicrobium salinarum TaxID=2058658 RepID=A0A2I0QZX9_9FLAO|nr:gliding motility-associated C-terminal domain-containing protein [Brumimicrobium salinarum]PKR79878.1 hypothetical protein CW751_13060 [Brumimicrobium salinarum]